MINISADDAKLFEQNGFTREQVGATINHYRQQGMSDNDIQVRMNNKIKLFKENDTSVENKKFNPFKATPDELNEKIKENAQNKLNKRIEWEKNHPVISRLQADYQPGYRVSRTDMERQAEYGLQQPLKEYVKDVPARIGQALVPYINGGRDAALSTLSGGSNIWGSLGREALIGALQGGTSESLDELSNNGLSTNVIKRGLGGSAGGAVGGALVGKATQALPLVWKGANWLGKKLYFNAFPGLKEETVKQLIKPNSIALDLNENTARTLLGETTERIQHDYKNLLDSAGQKVEEAALRLPNERVVFKSSLKNAIDDIFDKGNMSGNNEMSVARVQHNDIYNDILEFMNKSNDPEKLTASELNQLKKYVDSYGIEWNKTNSNDKTKLLRDIFWEYSRRLGNLSPELRKANRNYSRLAKFDDNEGVKKIISPQKIKDNTIDEASTALRNYKSSISSYNKSKNITNLEKLFIENGKQPFLNTVDDINAANELLKSPETGINPFDLLQKGKNLLERPILLANRKINREFTNVIEPRLQQIKPFFDKLPEATKRLLIPPIAGTTSKLLYGGINNYDDEF